MQIGRDLHNSKLFGNSYNLRIESGLWTNYVNINSHRSEISVVLSAFLFINEYYMYFMIIFDSQVSYFCENLEIVNKILQLRENSHHYDEYINTVDHDAMYLLNDYFPSRFNIQHVRNHQNEIKPEIKLTTVERLNIMADKLVGKTTGNPINLHINVPFAIYINGIYHPNKYRNKIRSISGEREAREFLKDKYN